MHHAEDGDVRADAQCQRQQRGDGESGCAEQRAKPVASVLQEPLDVRDALLIAVGFDRAGNTAELRHRRPMRGVRGHAAATELVFGHLEVKPHFVLEGRCRPAAQQEAGETGNRLANVHGVPSEFNNRPITSTRRFQSSASRASCFRPSFVSE